jgi:hypothetical protein
VNPVSAMEEAYERIGVEFSDTSRAAVSTWATTHEPGSHGQHSYDLAEFGLSADQVRERFAPYLESYDAVA